MDLKAKGQGKDWDKGPEMWEDFGGKDLEAVVNRMLDECLCVCVCARKHMRAQGTFKRIWVYYYGKSKWCNDLGERPPRTAPVL